MLPAPYEPITRPPPQVNKPVDGRDQNHPADHITERDRKEIIEEKANLRQMGELLHRLAYPFEDMRITTHEQGEGDKIHVRDGVLEAGRDKCPVLFPVCSTS